MKDVIHYLTERLAYYVACEVDYQNAPEEWEPMTQDEIRAFFEHVGHAKNQFKTAIQILNNAQKDPTV